MANYQFVIDSSFSPFTFQEQLMPFTMYKDAYEKEDEKYIELQKNADNFSYLADTLPEGSKAREIYEGYVNDLKKYGDDFEQNGLSISNRRGLTSMRRRYQGEIGRLDKADTALQEEIKRRQALNANDSTTLYAVDNLTIDDFLDRKRPDDYSVSGNKLYERGVQIGASDSARIWSDPQVQQVNKYYQSLYQTSGRDPRVLAAWRANLSSIPELKDSLDATLKEFGVTDHLTGSSLERARQSVINGIINGATYKRADTFQRDLSQMSAAEDAQNQRALDTINLNAASAGLKKNDKGDWVWDKDIDPTYQRALAVAQAKADNKDQDSKKGTGYTTISGAKRIEWNHNDPATIGDSKHKGKNYDVYYDEQGKLREGAISHDDIDPKDHEGDLVDWNDLPSWAQEEARTVIKNGDPSYYDFYFVPYTSRSIFPDTQASLDIVPRSFTKDHFGIGDGDSTDDANDLVGE